MKLSEYKEREKEAFSRARIKLMRHVLKLSVEELAKEAGILPEEVIAAEKGDISTVDKQFEIVQTYKEKYGVEPEWLLHGEGNVFFERGPNVSYRFYKENEELFDCIAYDRFSKKDTEAFIPTRFPRLSRIFKIFNWMSIKPTTLESQHDEYESIDGLESHTIICTRVKLVRELLGLTVEELAQEAGISPEEVIAVENGDNYYTENFHGNTQIYDALVGKYGVSLERLLFGKGYVFLERGPNVSYQFYRENLELFCGVSVKHYPELKKEEKKPSKPTAPGKTGKALKSKKVKEYRHETNDTTRAAKETKKQGGLLE